MMDFVKTVYAVLLVAHLVENVEQMHYGYINNQGNCVCLSQIPSMTLSTQSIMPANSSLQASKLMSNGTTIMSQSPQTLPLASVNQMNSSPSLNLHMTLSASMQTLLPSTNSLAMNLASTNQRNSLNSLNSQMPLSASAQKLLPSMSSLSMNLASIGQRNSWTSLNSQMSLSASMQTLHPSMSSLAMNSNIMENRSASMQNMNTSIVNRSIHFRPSLSFHSSMMYSRPANTSKSARMCICLPESTQVVSISPSKHISSRHVPSSSVHIQMNGSKVITLVNNASGVGLGMILMNLAISSVSKDGLMIYDGNKWKKLSKVSEKNAEVVLKTALLRFEHQGKENFYGAVFVNFTLTSEVQGSVDVTTKSSEMEKTIILLVQPKSPDPVFDIDLTPIRIKIKEDSKCTPLNPVVPISKINMKSLQSIPNVDPAVLAAFNNGVTSYLEQNFEESYAVSFITRGDGRWFYGSIENGNTLVNQTAFSSKFQQKLLKKFNFCFTPRNNYFGGVKMVVSPSSVSKSDGTEYVGKQSLTINIIVEPVNDRPTQGSSAFIKVPDLPYNETHTDPNGFTISTIMSQKDGRGKQRPAFKDDDGDTLGIGIVSAIDTLYGYWEYKCAGTVQWIKLNISYDASLLAVSRLDMVLLKPNDYLRFTLNGSKYWKVIDAQKKKINFQAVAWDQTTNQSCGSYVFDNSTESWPEAFSSRETIVTALQLRIGCNGKPGTDAVVDICGICGGDGKRCLGCDGEPNSGATYDSCNKCTGGGTGLKKNYLFDCYKQCGLYFEDDCKACQRIGKVRNYTDCAGQCYGKAKINKCGICAGGSTTKPVTQGMDSCGVCVGDNSTCADCNGVPNGDSKIDLCNTCLLPTAPTFNSGCVELGKFSPTVVYCGQPNVKIQLEASGLSKFNSVQCKFVGVQGTSVPATSSEIKNGYISITKPSLAGHKSYAINCSLGNSATKKAVGEFLVVNKTVINVTSVQPDVVYHNETTTATLTGNNFINSTELKCLFVSRRFKTVELTAEFVSATEIRCGILPVKMSVNGKLILSFVDHKREDYQQAQIGFHRSINVPDIQGGRFSKNLGFVIIEFSHRIQLSSRSISCADLFPSDFTTFGTKPKCKAAGNKLFVEMIGSPSFAPGNLQVTMAKIKYSGADYTVHPVAVETINIPVPANVTAPNVDLFIPKEIGPCDELKILVRPKGGGGGRKMNYEWSVKWSSLNSNPPTLAQNSSLLNVSHYLEAILPSDAKSTSIAQAQVSQLSPAYLEFNVTAGNFLGINTTNTGTVYIGHKNIPVLQLSTNKIIAKASDQLKIKAKVKVSSCETNNAVSYLWTLYNEDGSGTVDVPHSETFPTLVIRKGLKGGKIYRATVTVSMQSDPSLSAEASADIEIESSKPVAIITGPQTVGSNGTVTLSGKYSFDPNEAEYPTPQYLWKISHSSGESVIKDGSAIVDSLVVDRQDFNLNAENYLMSGERYLIELEYRIGTRVGTDRTYLRVIPGKPPIIIPDVIREAVNPFKRVGIVARIKSESKVSAVTWTNADNVEGEVRGGKSVSVFVIPKDVLEGGTDYTFTVSATNVDSTAEANLTISTNSRPTAGVIKASPLGGTSLTTKFSVSAVDGWTDPEGSALLFVYGYMKDGQDYDLTQPVSEMTSEGIILPSGNLTLYIKCYDKHGAYSKSGQAVVVTDAVITDAQFANFADENKKNVESGNYGSFFARTNAVMGQAQTESDNKSKRRRRSLSASNECDSLKQATIDYQVSTTGYTLQTYESGALQDDAAINIFVGTLAVVTNCGSVIFDAAIIKRSYEALSSALEPLVKKTETKVERDLKTFDNIIDTSRYNDSTQENAKTSFRSTVDRQGQRMCLNLLTGESSVTAKRSLVILQAVKLALDEGDTNFTSLGCPDNVCPSNLQAADYVKLGKHIQSNFGSSYTCGQTECSGVCVTSAQYPNDIFSLSLNSSMMSSVLDIKLWDTENSLSLNLTEIPSGMEVKILATKTTNQSYVCLRWDNATSSWINDGVETLTKSGVNMNDKLYVHCNVTTLGPLAIFEGAALPDETTTTTPATNTTLPTATTTLAPDNYPRSVTFKFPSSNCSSVLNVSESSMTQLEDHVASTIARAILIPRESLVNLTLSCGSLIVAYIQVHTTNMTAKEAVSALKTSLSSQFNVIINGQNLIANASSLNVVILPPPYVTTPSPPIVDKDDDDDLSGGAIAGIVIGVLLVIGIIAGVSFAMCCKKKTKKDPTVEPNANDVELRGKNNVAYDTSP